LRVNCRTDRRGDSGVALRATCWTLALSAQEAAAAANCLGKERPLERGAAVFKLIDDFSAKAAHLHQK
jgi:hypothetical protein